jgi:hypothetical protein
MANRTGGILTKQDVEFLLSDDYYEGKNSRQLRYQRRSDIRGRIVSSILDFETISNHLSQEEREKIFSEPENNGAESGTEFYTALKALIGWIYLGCRTDESEFNFENIIESAIIGAEEEYHRSYLNQPVDIAVDLDIDVVKKFTKISKLADMLEEGEPIEAETMYKLPTIDQVPINPENVDKVRVKSASPPNRQNQEKEIIESILTHHLGIEAEIEMVSTQAHVTGGQVEEVRDDEPTAVVPPEKFEDN